MKLNLLVIRSDDIDLLADFYTKLGCVFEKHSHGKGPEHYAYETDGFVFEIYPLSEKQSPTTSTRLGFQVESIESLIDIIKSYGDAKVITPLKQSPWGLRAVIEDPQGHRVELIQK